MATLNYREKKQPKLTFSQWLLKTIKKQKKRLDMDVTIGLTVSSILFLIGLTM